jgi:hypothetical protein
MLIAVALAMCFALAITGLLNRRIGGFRPIISNNLIEVISVILVRKEMHCTMPMWKSLPSPGFRRLVPTHVVSTM